MRLNPAAFDAFLADGADAIGQDFQWRKATICPCSGNPSSGAANFKCQLCFGKGWLWAAPVLAKAGMSQQENIKRWAQAGRYETGDATLTIPQSSPMYAAGEFDRITMMNSSEHFSLALVRGEGDRLYRSVISIERVFWLVNDTQIVEGGIPSVSETGQLTWQSGAPPLGTKYSISGEARDEYYIFTNLVSDRGEHFGARLPKKVIIRKFDIFGR